MLERLRQLLYRLGFSDAPTEAASDRNGLFSYAGEVHAFLLGVAAGYAAASLDRPEVAGAVMATALGYGGYRQVLKRSGVASKGESAVGEIEREPWYAIGGTIVGFAVGLAAVSGVVPGV